MTKKEKLIYLAGIIDGEGCMGRVCSTSKKRMKEGRKASYSVRCEVSNTSKKLIDWLYENFGGYKYPIKREENRKLQYRWKLRRKEMKKIIPQMIPYLIIKKNEAKQLFARFKRDRTTG
ncbi:MAG: LAGLIDADG family homing endonuclease [Candidatus Nealsonbacteria bacterium]